MALIPLEGLGTPSQKTSFLGGVVQILRYPRPSLPLADVGLFVRPKSQHSFRAMLRVALVEQSWISRCSLILINYMIVTYMHSEILLAL